MGKYLKYELFANKIAQFIAIIHYYIKLLMKYYYFIIFLKKNV